MVTLDLPTPPLPERTRTMCLIPASEGDDDDEEEEDMYGVACEGACDEVGDGYDDPKMYTLPVVGQVCFVRGTKGA